jgi:3-hydroxyisobutyrate dehydrogenase-like beta-hydroxyacid dehydrogenase
MGAAMATRLIDAGTPMTVWNRTASKTAPLVARGAVAAAGISGLAGCGIVFVTCTSSRPGSPPWRTVPRLPETLPFMIA